MQPLVAVEDIHTYYGKSHILNGVSLQVGRGRGGRPARAQRRRQEHHAQDHHGPGQPEPGQGAVRGQARSRGMPSHKLARLGIGYVPEDRRIFKLLTVMENLRTGLDRGGVTDAKQAAAARQGVHLFPAPRRAAQPGRRHAVGRRAADAGHRPRHDAGAQDHPAGRADRRPDAAHGLADPRDHRRAAPGRRRHPAGRAERAADARRPASASTSWRRARSATRPSPRSSK